MDASIPPVKIGGDWKRLRAFFQSPPITDDRRKGIAALSFLILPVGLLSLNHLLFLLYAAGLWLCMYWYFQNLFHWKREMFFASYIAESSSLRGLLQSRNGIKIRASIVAFLLSALTAAIFFSYNSIGMIAICIGIYFGSRAGSFLTETWLEHAKPHFRSYFHRKWVVTGSIVVAACAFLSANVISSGKEDYSQMTGTDIGHRLRMINHPIRIVQIVARGVDYLDTLTLRCRDAVRRTNPKAAWILYLFFSFPNLLPIYGAVAATYGLTDKILSRGP